MEEQSSPEEIKFAWKCFNWLFWPLLYLFATINGHIYRFVEMGSITRESGLGMVVQAQYNILPMLMVVLLYLVVSKFSSRGVAVGTASIGLLMTNYIYDVIPPVISYEAYCIILGVIAFGFTWYFKSKATKEVRI